MDPNKSKSPLSTQDLSSKESSPAVTTSTVFQSVESLKIVPDSKGSSIKLRTSYFVLATVMGLALLTGMSSNSPDFVMFMQKILLLCGGILTILLGIGTAKQVSSGIKFREQYGGNLNKLFIAGLILTVLSFLTFGISLIPGLILLYIGKKKIVLTSTPGNGVRTNSFLKVIYILFGFIGGALPALIITFIGANMLWSHWCDLTSSKCL